jgi:hypothetical protein
MLGDQSPLVFRHAVPTPPGIPPPFPAAPFPSAPGPAHSAALSPSVRSFKIAENQSPQPQDRVYFGFNFYSDVSQALNLRDKSPVDGLRVYRYVWGFEKTFNDGQGSVGLWLPLNTLNANSLVQSKTIKYGGTSTSLGDLTIYAKHILAIDRSTGSLISAGLALTPPTGPNDFAGAGYAPGFHSTLFQPFVGYIWNRGNFYLHGFSAIDVPTDYHDVTMLYNDVGIGYFLLRDPDPEHFLTAVAPTFETHVNTPLNHGDWRNIRDIIATPNAVNLTYGLNAEFYRRGILTFGFVTPVTGPRPFAFEVIGLFNYHFGGARRRSAMPPIIGG